VRLSTFVRPSVCTDGGGGGGQREKTGNKLCSAETGNKVVYPCYGYLAGSARYKNAVKMSGWLAGSSSTLV
jgi:hypothetical protein